MSLLQGAKGRLIKLIFKWISVAFLAYGCSSSSVQAASVNISIGSFSCSLAFSFSVLIQSLLPEPRKILLHRPVLQLVLKKLLLSLIVKCWWISSAVSKIIHQRHEGVSITINEDSASVILAELMLSREHPFQKRAIYTAQNSEIRLDLVSTTNIEPYGTMLIA